MFVERIEKTIEKYGMLSKGMRVGVGVSGGVDSMVLLRVLFELKEKWALELFVCHLNHNLRGEESLRDARFVEEVAGRYGLEFLLKTLPAGAKPHGVSLQSWARQERLKFFEEAVRKHSLDRVALGHNMDDNAETMLMRFLMGTSLEGLKGIEPVREPFIRPLIETGREEIEKYAETHSVEYVEDSTNRSTKYLRNRIRLELLPYLKERYNPSVVETLSRLSAVLRRDARYLESRATELFGKLAEVEEDGVSFEREELLEVDDALLTRLFMRATEVFGACRELMESAQAEQFIEAIRGKRPNLLIPLGGGLYLKRAYDRLTITRRKPLEKTEPREVPLSVSGITPLEGTGYLIKAEVVDRPRRLDEGGFVAYFDYESLPQPLVVRTFRAGDRIQPLGMKGTKKLKDLFIDEKVPLEERRKIPLLVADGRIIWVAGIRQSELFRVGKDTKRVLRVELLKENGNKT